MRESLEPKKLLKSWRKLVKEAAEKAVNSGQKVLFVRSKGLKNELWERSLEGERKISDLEDSKKVFKKIMRLK